MYSYLRHLKGDSCQDLDRECRCGDATSVDASIRVAEIGCGAGWSSIYLSSGFCNIHVDGIDVDSKSIELAHLNAFNHSKQLQQRKRLDHISSSSGTEQQRSKLQFAVGDLDELPRVLSEGSYDLVTMFECLHHMDGPVYALQQAKKLLKPKYLSYPGGIVLIAEERMEDRLEDMLPAQSIKSSNPQLDSGSSSNGSESHNCNCSINNNNNAVAKWVYIFSLFNCLPQTVKSMKRENSSAPAGAAMNPSLIKQSALQAGFSSVYIVHENECWRFYQCNL